jgi:biopolymer transport protein ExbB
MIELFFKGGFMMYPILLCSMAALGITIERLIYISSASARNKKFLEEARKVNGGPDRLERVREIAERVPSPVSNIVRAAVDHRDAPEDKRNIVIWRVGSAQRRDLEKFVNTLGMIAHVAPLLGLLGTVTGMIRAFMTIQALGGQVDATDLAGGIWEAMITTAAGLMVAIPAMFFYHFIEGRVDDVEAEMKDSAMDFPEIMAGFKMFTAGAKKESEPKGK